MEERGSFGGSACWLACRYVGVSACRYTPVLCRFVGRSVDAGRYVGMSVCRYVGMSVYAGMSVCRYVGIRRYVGMSVCRYRPVGMSVCRYTPVYAGRYVGLSWSHTSIAPSHHRIIASSHHRISIGRHTVVLLSSACCGRNAREMTSR